MAPVNGRPFLEYLMDYWIGQGVNHFILSVGYMKEVVMEHFGARYRSIPIQYSIEDSPLGTGGALLVSAQDQSEPFVVLNGDTYFEVLLTELLSFHERNKADLSLSLFQSDEQKRFGGVEINRFGALIALRGEGQSPRTFANGGAYLFNPYLLATTTYRAGEPCSLEKDLIPQLLTQGSKIYGLFSPAPFIDIGVPSDLKRASSFLREA
jgi:D-glycero-alpha-D-manno-heptose 1-phosphate guanylyltransferase